MADLGAALLLAFDLIARLEPELMATVLLSLRVSLSVAVLALGAPLGALLATTRFPSRAGRWQGFVLRVRTGVPTPWREGCRCGGS